MLANKHNQTLIQSEHSRRGRLSANHNQTVVRRGRLSANHNQTAVRPAPGVSPNHNQTARSSR